MLVAMTLEQYYGQPGSVDLYGGTATFDNLSQVQRRLELLDSSELPVRVTIVRKGRKWLITEYCMMGKGIKLP